MNTVELGQKIRAKREELGLTRQQLAEKSGHYSYRTMGNLETGRFVASPVGFEAIAKVLGMRKTAEIQALLKQATRNTGRGYITRASARGRETIRDSYVIAKIARDQDGNLALFEIVETLANGSYEKLRKVMELVS